MGGGRAESWWCEDEFSPEVDASWIKRKRGSIRGGAFRRPSFFSKESMMMAHGNHFYPAIVIWILCITVRVTLSEDLTVAESEEKGEQQLDNKELILPRAQRSAVRPISMMRSDVSELSQTDPSDDTAWKRILGGNDPEKITESDNTDHRDDPKGLILYTAKIINMLRLKRGFSVITRLFPHFLFPSIRSRKTAYQQRAVSDDYYSEMPARRGPPRPFRPRLRWG